ncbi:phosphoribosyltransferase family protein [Paenibacillus sp. N1-5-1-14]|uniref:phosphoribosyltransferase family protein n=1 Tax=Paenibacillus radicibacter TaxID=2972488 RepID=UPI002158A87A|nr:phosphoribosyltransferase family protein [Paenibacillus radicibacter]MCR8641405.1 phosphoribosyltransferase family protein [Paenibacillus radicibacter]
MIKLNNEVVTFTSFPNGETKLEQSGLIILTHNKIVFKYENDGDLIKLMFLKKYLDTLKVICSLTIMYMPYSRMDRSENDSPFTLKYVTEYINLLQFYSVELVEPHSDVSIALLNNCRANYIDFELLKLVIREIDFDIEQDYIMFPDAGASKRYSKMKYKNVIVGDKERDFQSGEIKEVSLHGNFKGSGKKVIIVDDLSSYGGTFVKSAKALRDKGFNEVYLLVAHAENSIFKGELFNHINKVFTTNSIVSEQNHWDNLKYKEQLKIYELEEVL